MNGVQPRPLKHRGRLNRRGRNQARIYRWRTLNDYPVREHYDFVDATMFLWRRPAPRYFDHSLERTLSRIRAELDPPVFEFPRMPPLPPPRLPTTRVCGVDVVINSWLTPGWFGTVKGIGLVAASVEAAEAVLGRIAWTEPPCWMGDDGKLVEIPREDGAR